ncbi:DUF3347 domain-containing protein [Chitinophaga nivalis]|uniref:DUF3347 domain-containing protein n=1 Tax=Chitinophaga nivalis TaxID=2991709 RepID=A0ABT3IQ75_9BACT|nr:DUF3347 domain-containing protein [Chitinophaga nivalis]MCW3464200.1 DUF3347 domain-containing protein [Chitinophaga nivalis]MCW3486110.1 DUF3347 domain-containing protein [Chitinophaga nivalis]
MIKKWMTGIGLLLVTFFWMACGNGNDSTNNKATTDSAAAAPQQDTVSVTPVAGVVLKEDALNAIYIHYMRLTDALTAGEVAAARIAGSAIEAGAANIPGGAGLARTAAGIMAAGDIETQRTAFAALSEDFIALVKKSGLQRGTLYVDFCPMAMNDKGAYWLSANKVISNPYFGAEMLTCGEVKTTIQ